MMPTRLELIGPTRQELAIQLGTVRADRDRLLRLVFAIEAGLEDGTATVAWKSLLSAAKWMRDGDARGDHDGTR